ncbi:hypothetical protein BJ508DRAFT_133194 [Ascobolus immersus RN42]|uniref:PHD-type domain-containing protein n=1 Tax=Ascobolus immersus RN42 TaxID=1160509 RepID=A0A3N4IQ86_ASCIM|nr:hypothetical protein BJ508DRAFT_133194 [Ascobolus immersus RN42]
MTRIEREWCALERRIPRKQFPNPKKALGNQTHTTPNRNISSGWGPDEMGDDDGEGEDTKCNICDDGECENSNAIVFCDGCDLAVHQDCYGIPHIPEGQYHCRRCLTSPSAAVSCVLCPNLDGAFKQTVENSWAHLLCALWIPELSLANPVYMEPVEGLDKIPKSRWKLSCYICRRKMGACIQCANKSCYVAFHVTCARRARLFLKMTKNPNGNPPFETSSLRALCHKHVPPNWKRENNTDEAYEKAVEFYQESMDGVQWGAQATQVETVPASYVQEIPSIVNSDVRKPASPSRRKKSSPKKTPWKLPSGTPVIPHVIFSAVVESLQPFHLRNCEVFVAEVCKYWALKREARKGAPLIKRFQSQMDTFPSMEVTRRNYAQMVGGRDKLLTRTEFAGDLQKHLSQVVVICDGVTEREMKMKEMATILHGFVTKVYLPENELLWPILEAARSHDTNRVFSLGFNVIRSRLEDSLYTSVQLFAADLEDMLLSPPKFPDFAILIPEDLPVTPSSRPPHFTGIIPDEDLVASPLGRKILDAVKPMIGDAMESESALQANQQAIADMQANWKAIQAQVAQIKDPVPALSYELDFSPKSPSHPPQPSQPSQFSNIERVLDNAPASPQSSGNSAYHTPRSNHEEQQLAEHGWDMKSEHYAGNMQHLLQFTDERWPGLGSENGRETSPLSEPDEDAFARMPPAKPFELEMSNPSPPETRINGDGNEEMDGVETGPLVDEPLQMDIDPPNYPLSPPIGSPSEQLKEQLFLEMAPQTNGIHPESEPQPTIVEPVTIEAEVTKMDTDNLDPHLFNIDVAEDDDSPLSSPVPSPSTPEESEILRVVTDSPRRNAKRGATVTPRSTPKKKVATAGVATRRSKR